MTKKVEPKVKPKAKPEPRLHPYQKKAVEMVRKVKHAAVFIEAPMRTPIPFNPAPKQCSTCVRTHQVKPCAG